MKITLRDKSLITLLFLMFASCTVIDQNKSKEFENNYFCDAESVDIENNNFREASGEKLFFGNSGPRTEEDVWSGNYSIKLTPENPYGFTIELKNIGADEYFHLTAWRKSKSKNGVVVIDGGNGFYEAGKNIIERSENGWEKIELEVFTPPDFNSGKIKIYVWNNSPETIYFDDLKIFHSDKKVYHEFEDQNALHFYADDYAFNNFNKKRLEAFKTSVLVNSDEDFENLVVFDGNDFLNGSFRLKGDLTDHLGGQKWSFRIKLKKAFTWNGMFTFSIHNPVTRDFLSEWFAHKIFEQEDVLTPRYGFVPVYINNKSLGIYAWEEHFEKQLVESKKRREGPILKFDENLFWQRVKEAKTSEQNWDVDYFNAAQIIPFKRKRTVSDTLLKEEFSEGHKLMLQYKNRSKSVSEVFDIDKLARYYALIDVTQFYHGFTWHNQRFYFNPVTCLLEPVAFDGYTEDGVYKRTEEPVFSLSDPTRLKDLSKEELMLYQVFSDVQFNSKYVSYLMKYCDKEFISSLNNKFRPEIEFLENNLKKEFSYYQFDRGMINDQANLILSRIAEIEKNIIELGAEVESLNNEKFAREYEKKQSPSLTPLLIQAYYDSYNNTIDVLNYHNNEVVIWGVFMESTLPISFENKPVLKPYKGVIPQKVSFDSNGIPQRLLITVEGKYLEIEVNHWAYNDGLSSRQKINGKSFTDLNVIDNKVVFDGSYIFENNIIIPDSLDVIINPGTTIDLIKGAGFISFASVEINGLKDNPVRIFSSDFSGMGFNVIQADKPSFVKYAVFNGLSNLKMGGWVSTAAVNFYEADVSFLNCTFDSNKNCDDALNIIRSDFFVEKCNFVNTFADAFDSDFCTGNVVGCTFKTIGNDAIDFSGSRVSIEKCLMEKITDKAISGGENSYLKVLNCKINEANIGIASKDLSELEIDGVFIENTVYGMIAFMKKPEYGASSIVVNNINLKNNVSAHKIEIDSKLVMNGKIISGIEKDLALKLYQ